MKEYTGNLVGTHLRVAIVVARFNELVTKSLLAGALDALKRHGVAESDISVAWVPGAFEIPVAAKAMAAAKKYDAVICLGAVIRGATAHFEYVAGPATSGMAQLALEAQIPVLNGVITTENIEQALERAGTKCGNKGAEAAVGAIEMANLLKSLSGKATL